MDSPPLAIACVLKTGVWRGGRYKPEQVLWLKRQVEAHLPLAHRFVCLSDVDIPGVEVIPLEHGWPGWWSKIELFKHDLGRVLYLDLDTVIVGSLAAMVSHPHKFTALQALSREQRRCLNSGVLAWQGPRLDLFEEFARRPAFHMKRCTVKGNWGDQGFIHHHVGAWEAWQEILPGAVLSYKLHLEKRLAPPPGASGVCFHGKPKPRGVNHAWVPK
mgnify:CR=1 FL=1